MLHCYFNIDAISVRQILLVVKSATMLWALLFSATRPLASWVASERQGQARDNALCGCNSYY